jgi:hypothetical protein
VQEKALSYQGDDVMLPMGSDFMYQDADRWSDPVFCTQMIHLCLDHHSQ